MAEKTRFDARHKINPYMFIIPIAVDPLIGLRGSASENVSAVFWKRPFSPVSILKLSPNFGRGLYKIVKACPVSASPRVFNPQSGLTHRRSEPMARTIRRMACFNSSTSGMRGEWIS